MLTREEAAQQLHMHCLSLSVPNQKRQLCKLSYSDIGLFLKSAGQCAGSKDPNYRVPGLVLWNLSDPELLKTL